MKVKISIAPVINFALLTIIVCAYHSILDWSRYPNFKNKYNATELITDIFQGLVKAAILILVLYGIYFILFRLFLRKLNTIARGIIFSVLLSLILFILLNTIAFGPGKDSLMKFAPFTVVCFLLPVTEYLIDQILSKTSR